MAWGVANAGAGSTRGCPPILSGRPFLSTIDLQGRGGVVYLLEPALLLIKTTLDS